MSRKITRRGFVQQSAAALAPFALAPGAEGQARPAAAPQQAAPRPAAAGDRWDFVVAGAGHNSLITAAYLTKAGFKVLVLEGRPQIGGGTKTSQLTVRGFMNDVCSCNHDAILSNPAIKNNELKLGDYGLEFIHPDPIKHVPFLDGSYVTFWKSFERTVEEIAKYSKADADTYVKMADEHDQYRAGGAPKGIWQRRAAMTKLKVLRTFFKDERTQVAMMHPWPVGIVDDHTGLSAFPSRKNTGGAALPKGGAGVLADSLGRCIEAHGGVIMVNKPVMKLVIEGGRCTGVECEDGSIYRASKAVVSTIHIKRLIDMAPKELWGDAFVEGVATFDTGTAGLNTHYAMSVPLQFPVKGGFIEPVHSGTLQTVARGMAFDYELKAGLVDMEAPVLHVVQPTAADPSRAPKGGYTVRLLGRQPYELAKGGAERWAEIQEEVSLAHLRFLQKLAPTFTDDKILGKFIVNPVTTERMNAGMWHGSCHGGTDGAAQAGELRPVPGWSNYQMPIPGLYQTGGTTSPGGGVSGLPGRGAAAKILKDFGKTIEQVAATQ